MDGTLGVYELQNINLLRDVFIWAYERSCQRYIAIKETMAEPDPHRLLYRESLILAVSEIVGGMQQPTRKNVAGTVASLVPPQDLEHFLDLAIEDLVNLHEGNVTRFRLRLSEYLAWQPFQTFPDKGLE